MKKHLCRLVSLTVVFALLLSISVTAFAASPNNNEVQKTEIITDDTGNTFKLTYSIKTNSDTHAALYDSNGILLQETFVYPVKNRIVEYQYHSQTTLAFNDSYSATAKEYIYSDLISAAPAAELSPDESQNFSMIDTPQYQANIPFPVFNDEEWSLVNHLPPAPASPYSIDLYAMNYDQEPDSNRFSRKTLNLPAKIALTTLAGILAGFLTTGGITTWIVLRSLGAAVITQGAQYIINNAIQGSVCYSTQKILYAPVVEGYNVYPNAYITKLWLVSENAVTDKTTITLARESYQYSHKPTQEELMYAARGYFTATVGTNYGK